MEFSNDEQLGAAIDCLSTARLALEQGNEPKAGEWIGAALDLVNEVADGLPLVTGPGCPVVELVDGWYFVTRLQAAQKFGPAYTGRRPLVNTCLDASCVSTEHLELVS